MPQHSVWNPGGAKYEKKAAKSIGDATHVSEDIICCCVGLSPVTLFKLRKQGVVKQVSAGRYNLYETVQAIVSYMRHGTAFNTIAVRRESKLEQEIRKLTLQNEIEEGKLIYFDDAKQVVNEMIAVVRRGHESLGGRTSNKLAGMTNPAEIRQYLQGETRAIDAETSETFKRMSAIRHTDRTVQEQAPDIDEEEPEETTRKKRA